MNRQLIEIHLFSLGWDEAPELMEKIADLLAEAGYGGDAEKQGEPLRSVICLKLPTEDDVTNETVMTFMEELAKDAVSICIPLAARKRGQWRCIE